MEVNADFERRKKADPALVSKNGGAIFTPSGDYTRQMAEFDALVGIAFSSHDARVNHARSIGDTRFNDPTPQIRDRVL